MKRRLPNWMLRDGRQPQPKKQTHKNAVEPLFATDDATFKRSFSTSPPPLPDQNDSGLPENIQSIRILRPTQINSFSILYATNVQPDTTSSPANWPSNEYAGDGAHSVLRGAHNAVRPPNTQIQGVVPIKVEPENDSNTSALPVTTINTEINVEPSAPISTIPSQVNLPTTNEYAGDRVQSVLRGAQNAVGPPNMQIQGVPIKVELENDSNTSAPPATTINTEIDVEPPAPITTTSSSVALSTTEPQCHAPPSPVPYSPALSSKTPEILSSVAPSSAQLSPEPSSPAPPSPSSTPEPSSPVPVFPAPVSPVPNTPAQIPQAPAASYTGATLKDSCNYGVKCFRRNLQHRNDMAHPGDPDYRRPDFPEPPPGTPDCPFGASCYRRNPQHFFQLRHPPASTYDPKNIPASYGFAPIQQPAGLPQVPNVPSQQQYGKGKRQRKPVKYNGNNDDDESDEEDPFHGDSDSSDD